MSTPISTCKHTQSLTLLVGNIVADQRKIASEYTVRSHYDPTTTHHRPLRRGKRDVLHEARVYCVSSYLFLVFGFLAFFFLVQSISDTPLQWHCYSARR